MSSSSAIFWAMVSLRRVSSRSARLRDESSPSTSSLRSLMVSSSRVFSFRIDACSWHRASFSSRFDCTFDFTSRSSLLSFFIFSAAF
uniref:Putative secreted protein n=1 Tax=Ixodes ricinus TaxID=34613 RepID=A0A6B0UB64_IXORI